MPTKVLKGGTETPILKKRKQLTEAGYPELARTAQKHTDVKQAIKTAEKLKQPKGKGKLSIYSKEY